jgi:hypothetical protein
MIWNGNIARKIRNGVILGQGLQQVKGFKYVGCEISYEKRKDMQLKLARFALNTGNFKHF